MDSDLEIEWSIQDLMKMNIILAKIESEGRDYFYKYYTTVPVCFPCYRRSIFLMQRYVSDYETKNGHLNLDCDLDTDFFKDFCQAEGMGGCEEHSKESESESDSENVE